MVGGGSNNSLLNQITANTCNLTVEAGPGEATAVGNLMVQMIATEGYNNLAAAREDIRNSSVLKLFQPQHTRKEYEAVEKYKKMTRG
ncbi:FGGY-family carbohydrate kinase [Lactococcus garvieae]|uniref:FGGY-family carbohydrate kinase n=1 Tax=Lactococcus garvieae TaxID=1363 RepID=UPI0020CFC4A9|nr:FGGY-family carbohydrate kinase [Lactococcus garvieae]